MAINVKTITHDSLMQDPYPTYQRLRREAPVAYVAELDQWWITRWDDCATVGRLTGTDALLGGHIVDREFFGGPSVLTMDGAKHEALRVGIDHTLRPRGVKEFADDIGRTVTIDYLEKIKPLGRADLVTELFEHISVRVVGNRLGLHDVPEPTLVEWFHALSGGLTNLDSSDDISGRARRSLTEIDDYMRAKIAELTKNPDESLISHMIHGGVPEGQPARTFDDVMPSIRVIILGGFQEPGNAVSNAFLGLFENPEQMEVLRAHPDTYASLALHESLRWIAPIGVVARLTAEEIEVAGVTIPAGAQVGLIVASANRDEERYQHPDRFDLTREKESHATFGFGNHHCSGHFLAKSLGEIVVEETVARLPGLRADPNRPAEVSGYLFRGTKSLPAVWDI